MTLDDFISTYDRPGSIVLLEGKRDFAPPDDEGKLVGLDRLLAVQTKHILLRSGNIFYDDLNNPEEGGTGHTLKTCRLNNVPFIDQRIWFGWLA